MEADTTSKGLEELGRSVGPKDEAEEEEEEGGSRHWAKESVETCSRREQVNLPLLSSLPSS